MPSNRKSRNGSHSDILETKFVEAIVFRQMVFESLFATKEISAKEKIMPSVSEHNCLTLWWCEPTGEV